MRLRNFYTTFQKKNRDVAGHAVIYIPLGGGSKPSQWLKYHEWKNDWQDTSIVKHLCNLPINVALGATKIRKSFQSFTTTGANPHNVFTAVEMCRGGGKLLLFHSTS